MSFGLLPNFDAFTKRRLIHLNAVAIITSLREETMRVHVKVAKTPKEIDGVFRICHKVFIGEDGKFPAQSDYRMYDFFDTIPATVNIIAMVNDEVIAAACDDRVV